MLAGFAWFYIHAVITGTASLYVHPRIVPYLLFASVIMIIVALLRIKDLFKPQAKKPNPLPLLFFVVPLIMAFTIAPEPFDSSMGSVGDIQLSGANVISDAGAGTMQDTLGTGSAQPDAQQSETGDTSGDGSAPGSLLQDGVVVLDSENFYDYLCRIYASPDEYIGAPIEVVGFVFRDNDGIEENEFIAARLMMVCCAADMQPVGLLCRYDGTPELETDSWVKVSGTIAQTDFDGETIPCIAVKSVEAAQEPDEFYIYPF